MRRERNSLLFGGLAGFISIAVIQIVTLAEYDLPLRMASYCLSFSLPASVFFAISSQEHLSKQQTAIPFLYEATAIGTVIIGFIGITALFYHFGSIPAIIFGVSGFIAVMCFNHLNSHKKKYFILDKRKKKSK